MIPVSPVGKPPNFDQLVAVPGQAWLRDQGIPVGGKLPKGTEVPPLWQKTQKQLWTSYNHTCAYLAIYFEWSLGASSTDHFVPKSLDPWKAFDWSNYRLSALGPNRRKGKKRNILDPFQLHPDTFHINFANGSLTVNPTLPASVHALAQDTVDELGLNDPETCRMRVSHFEESVGGHVSPAYLQRQSPFVYVEMLRQGLIP